MSLSSHRAHPRLSLTSVFTAWKSLLLAISLGTALGSDYDTSASLFFDVIYGPASRVPALASRLTKWDALYFMHAARDDYIYEQEWAFGTGLPLAVKSLRHAGGLLGVSTSGVAEPTLAIFVAHISHLTAVLALYELTVILFKNRNLAYVASVLHIISPAGLFLSAPYAESPFACLSFIGNLLFAISLKDGGNTTWRPVAQVGAGIAFGVGALFRSNGILSGLPFAVEAVKCLLAFMDNPSLRRLLNIAALLIGGLCILAGFVAPQLVAWIKYCGNGQNRPWCSRLVPSIYTFVQSHYWNVGFLKYWTPGNIPLFLLAGPVLALLVRSAFEVLRGPLQAPRAMIPAAGEPYKVFVQTLAASQLLLAVLAMTSYHIQIITRIASGYPVWYWWVASSLADKRVNSWGWTTTVFMVMYGTIQGVLFASFLPPA